MSVYIELVIFNNLAIDLLLIVAVQVTRRRKLRKLRTVLAVAIGALCATYYAVAPKWAAISIKATLAPIMTLIFDKYGGENRKQAFWDYFKSLACFVCYTYLTGGVVYGLSFAIGADINSYAITGISALGVAFTLICAKCVARKRVRSAESTRNIILHVDGKSIQAIGLCDSGNSLVDNVSGLPVIIISSGIEKQLGKISIDGYINVSTVGGENLLPIVAIDDIEIDKKREKVIGALCGKEFSNFDIILQNSIF